MVTRWHGLNIFTLAFCIAFVHRSSSYLHDAPFNPHTFTVEDVLPPLAPLSKSQLSARDRVAQCNHCSSIPVVYTNDPESISLWLSENVPDGQVGIIGFDTESLPIHYRRYRKKAPSVATVQLATPSSCLVVHLVRHNFGVPTSECAEVLKRIINDPNYIKAGCAINEDMMDLYSLWGGLDAKSRLDLGAMGCDQRNRVGLRALAARTLHVDLPKIKKIIMSDWTKVPLTRKQIVYSARDAWAGAAIAEQLAKDDPSVFNPDALVESLDSELPIATLLERKRKREHAKDELNRLLKPFKRDRRRHLPKHVKREATRLRRIIKSRVVESTCVLHSTSTENVVGRGDTPRSICFGVCFDYFLSTISYCFYFVFGYAGMGISGFLSKVLDTAGRPVDLRDYAKGTVQSRKRKRRRKFRIGVDLTSSIYKAAYGFGDMLGDERLLTNYGRMELLQEQSQAVGTNDEETVNQFISRCCQFVMTRLQMLRKDADCDILVVFDGLTPPVKKIEATRRRDIRHEHVRQRDAPLDPNHSDFRAAEEARVKANRRAGAGKHFGRIVVGLVESLKEANIAYLVAPYEADGQLAYMSKMGYIDLIISEDSDLIAHGAKAVIYNYISGNGFPDEGKLLQFEDLGEVPGKFDLSDFSPQMMAILFVCVGCDYCEKLKGIGLGTAAKIVREAYFGGSESPLATIFSQLYEKCWEKNIDKRDYESRFVAAVFTYQHPIVFDPVQGKQLMQAEREIKANSKLKKHETYARLCEDEEERKRVIGIVKEPEEAARIAAVTPCFRKARKVDNGSIDEQTSHPYNQESTRSPTSSGIQRLAKDSNIEISNGPDSHQRSSKILPAHSQAGLDSGSFCSQSQEIGLLGTQDAPPCAGSQKTTAGESEDTEESPRFETQINSEQCQTALATDSGEHPDQALQIRSPNLLYSSTPDKSQSQRSEQSSLITNQSPDLLK